MTRLRLPRLGRRAADRQTGDRDQRSRRRAEGTRGAAFPAMPRRGYDPSALSPLGGAPSSAVRHATGEESHEER